ncbi:MAG: LysR substrate-binding domain-containing protein [Pseudomonadota bacterium]
MMKLLRLRDLEYFIAIAEHGSFSRAADACGISQPTLSSQLRRMEDLLGVTLLERRHGAAVVTAEGSEVLSAAREIMESFYKVQRTTAGDGVLLGRNIRFGVLPTIAPYFAPGFLARLSALNAEANIDFQEDQTDALEAAVEQDVLEFAITATLPRLTTLVSLPLGSEKLTAVSAKPLPARVDAEELAGPILLMQEGHCFREVVSEAIRRANLRADRVVTTRIGAASFSTLLSLVRSGLGDTILPEPFVRQNAASLADLHAAALEPAAEGREIQLVVRKGRERYRDVERLAQLARQALTVPADDMVEALAS